MYDVVRLFASLRRLARSLGIAWSTMVTVTVMSVVSGALNIGLLALINQGLGGDTVTTTVWAFVALCTLLPLSRFLSQVLLTRLNESIVQRLRSELARRILRAPLRQLEQMGAARLLATLTNDLGTITQTLLNLPLVLMHGSVVASCLFYLGWLSPRALLIVLAFMVVGIVSYQLPMLRGIQSFRKARAQWDEIYDHLRGLVDGLKELKLNIRRRHSFVEELLDPAGAELRRWNLRAMTIFAAASAWGQVLFFILIGLLVFYLPHLGAGDPSILIGATLVLLFMIGSLELLLGVLPNLGQANVAIHRVEELGLALAEEVANTPDPMQAPAPRGSWRRLELRGVTHEYRRDGSEDHFTLGPIDFELAPGEIVFITGGNGSGKTTLAKLLTGLYVPRSGNVVLDGEVIDDEAKRASYRELFTAIFSDFFLFEKMLGLDAPDLDARARHYLETLHLERKLSIDDGRLSTLELSQGQRKRLALLVAYLEDRSIYLFDEWAADQDPEFKNIFYRELLPELRARGKCLVVITHDDRFFAAADRRLHLEEGRVVAVG